MTTTTVNTLMPARPASTSATSVCEHAWALDSRHTTSLGVVRYESCVRCATHRVDLLPLGAVVPSPLTRVIAPRI